MKEPGPGSGFDAASCELSAASTEPHPVRTVSARPTHLAGHFQRHLIQHHALLCVCYAIFVYAIFASLHPCILASLHPCILACSFSFESNCYYPFYCYHLTYTTCILIIHNRILPQVYPWVCHLDAKSVDLPSPLLGSSGNRQKYTGLNMNFSVQRPPVSSASLRGSTSADNFWLSSWQLFPFQTYAPDATAYFCSTSYQVAVRATSLFSYSSSIRLFFVYIYYSALS